MGNSRYLWGKTKMDKAYVKNYIDFAPQSTAPSASRGRMYMDNRYSLHLCADGSTYATVWQMIATSNPPWRRRGAVYMDSSYKLRVCEDGSTFKTVTTT